MPTSSEFLVDHAYRSVWCSPGQDRQYIVAPTRNGPAWGVLGDIKVGMRSYPLPTTTEWYHVFVIGDLPPNIVGMSERRDAWISVQAHCNSTSLLVDLYLNNGKHLPTSRAYFLFTRNGCLLIAFKHTPLIADLGKEQLFIRWRSNAWFDREDAPVGYNAGIVIEGMVYSDQSQFTAFQSRWRAKRDSVVGGALAYVNGYRVKDINIGTCVLGDHLEYVYDASIKQILEIPVVDLLAFDSIRDTKGKFLLPRPGLGTTIDYCDDVDVFLLNYQLPQKFIGLYYHQNQPDAVRNVTHRDFSICSTYLRGYVDNTPTWSWSQDLRVEVVVRHSGWQRQLVDEHSRIKELFKLSEPDRLDVMVGEDSLVSVWDAAALENSGYIKLMDKLYGEITRPEVRDAYGYNAISKLVGNTPQKVVGPSAWITLPINSTPRSTVFEYDGEGRLIDWHNHSNSYQYPVRSNLCKYVESYSGHGGVGHFTEYDRLESTLEANADYRFYMCDTFNSNSGNAWVDVTNEDGLFVLNNGTIRWLVDQSRYLTAVRSDVDFLCYTLDLNYKDDLITLTVRSEDVMAGLVPVSGVMEIPPGELDIMLNGWDLIEDIDYYVEWPQICIINKTKLVPGDVQRVVVRGRGFCDVNLQRDKSTDVGFVSYGKLSHNARFNLRDDRVCRISIGGSLFTQDEVAFSEDGVVVSPFAILNGSPYKVTHPIIPMLDVTSVDTYTLRGISELIDKEVSDYLSIKLPEVVEGTPSPAPAWYTVFSPLCSKLIYDMLLGILPMDEFSGEYSDQYVRERLRGYDWILPYDPAIRGVNENYVVIHPHQ